MECKSFEIRDAGTFVPVLAIKLAPADERDRFLLARAGFGTTPDAQAEYVILAPLVALEKTSYDPFGHHTGARTYRVAHEHILECFDQLPNGAVVDVEFILNERTEPKVSEAETHPLQ